MPLPTTVEFARIKDTGEIVRILGVYVAPKRPLVSNFEPVRTDGIHPFQFLTHHRYLVRRIIHHYTKGGEPAHEYIEQQFFGAELEATTAKMKPGGILSSLISDVQDGSPEPFPS